MLQQKHWLLLILLFVPACSTHAQNPPMQAMNPVPFAQWLADFKNDALSQGISQGVLDEAFADVQEPSPDIITQDHSQPEHTKTFPEYVDGVLTETKIANGKENWESHRAVLKQIEAEYNVPAPILLSLWGIESNYGARQGSHVIVESLTTLAYDGRRSAFFRKELINALKIIQDQHMSSKDLTGSWAGAMGQTQFMPTSYLAFAVDFDGDGKKDIWNNDADALASIANYLHQKGWDSNVGWGFAVSLPQTGTDWNDTKGYRPASEWQELGVTKADGSKLSAHMPEARLVLPDNVPSSAYLVFSNYDVLMDWNRSTYFATTVGLLSNAIREP